MNLNTHLSINRSLCGQIITLEENRAVVRLDTIAEMAADEHQLVHGGFIFAAADFAAMAAVNDPNVVLGSAEARFLKPTKCGDALTLEANVAEIAGKKHRVEVEGADEAGTKVFSGVFTCFVLEKHVLEK